MVKNLPAMLPTMQETWVQSLGVGRSPGEGNGNPLQYSWTAEPSSLQSVGPRPTQLSG